MGSPSLGIDSMGVEAQALTPKPPSALGVDLCKVSRWPLCSLGCISTFLKALAYTAMEGHQAQASGTCREQVAPPSPSQMRSSLVFSLRRLLAMARLHHRCRTAASHGLQLSRRSRRTRACWSWLSGATKRGVARRSVSYSLRSSARNCDGMLSRPGTVPSWPGSPGARRKGSLVRRTLPHP